MRNFLLSTLLAAVVSLPLMISLTGCQPQQTADIVSINPTEMHTELLENTLKIGDTVPDFTLPDATGNDFQMAKLLEKGPVVLTFYRGHWCPYCNVALSELQSVMSEINAAGASLVAISPLTPDNTLTMVEKHDLEFHVLSDADNKVAHQFNLVTELDDTSVKAYKANGIDLANINGTRSNELPIPATFVINQAGTITYTYINEDYQQRAQPEAVVAALKAIK